MCVAYCTSDAFTGATENRTGDWFFRGSNVIDGALSLLVDTLGLGAVPGGELVFGGTSAGGRGAMASLDSVAAHFSKAKLRQGISVAVYPVAVVGALNSPLWVDVQPMYVKASSRDRMRGSLRSLVVS